MRFFHCLFLFGVSCCLMAMDSHNDPVSLPILSKSMTIEDWKNFAKVGGGYYPIPEELRKYFPKTLDLAQSLNASWKDQPGYFSEGKQQIEFLYWEKRDWDNYPPETKALAQGMNEVAVFILLNVLRALEIDPDLYPKVTGGLSALEGKSFFKIAHYDSVKNYPGIPWHKDIRWITVLFINQEGLQGNIDSIIFDVKPLEGYFVVNLGVFFEAFINNREKLNALVHQVTQVKNERVSFGVFCEGDYADKGFYQLNGLYLRWGNEQEMKTYLIEDKDKSFSSIGPHIIFNTGANNK
jgi:isopenicillin N synthase-like dioxygenase